MRKETILALLGACALVNSAVTHAAEIPVLSYSTVPETYNGAAGGPWMRDEPFGQLTDGIYLDESDPENQYTSAKNVAWGMANGTGPTLYFDFGQVMSLSSCTLHYRIDTIWGIVPPRQLTFSFSSEASPNTSDPDNDTGWSGALVEVVPDETGHLRSQYMTDLSSAGSARWVRVKLVCDSYEPYDPWTVLHEIDFDDSEEVLITSQPQDVVVREGETAFFSVTAQGSEPLNYQWQKDGIDVVDDTRISGAMTNTLTVRSVQIADASGAYTCVVADGAHPEGVLSEPAELNVVGVSAYGRRVLATEPYIYWTFDEEDGDAKEMVSLDPGRALTSNNPTREAHGDCGNAAVFDDTIDAVFGTDTLGASRLEGPFAIEFFLWPSERSQWSYMMEAGNADPALLMDFVSGPPRTLTYYTRYSNHPITAEQQVPIDYDRWYHVVFVNYDNGAMDAYLDGVQVAGFGPDIDDDQPADVLYLDLSGPFHLGHYDFGVSSQSFKGMLDEWAAYDLSGLGETAIAALGQAIASHGVLSGPAYVSLHPSSQTVLPEETATLKCVAAGAEPITYQWKKDGLVLTDSAALWGVDGPVLHIASVVPADEGSYTCVVSNGQGNDESQGAALTVDLTIYPVSPVSGHTMADPNTAFAWTAGYEADSYDVYLGADPNALAYQTSTAETTCYLDVLAYGTTYFWRVDMVTGGQTITGQVGHFTTRPEPNPITLELQYRDPGSGEPYTEEVTLDARRMGIVIIDEWDIHWDWEMTQRSMSFIPRLNHALDAARDLGITIVHAPAGCIGYYEGWPQREATLAMPHYSLPPSNGYDPSLGFPGCDWLGDPFYFCMVPPGMSLPTIDPYGGGYTITRENPDISIGPDDFLVNCDNAQELYNITQYHGLTQLLFTGCATNMCVPSRECGMYMARYGLEVVLLRDLTEAFTTNKTEDYTPDMGTRVSVDHIETYWGPSIHSSQLLAGRTDALYTNQIMSEAGLLLYHRLDAHPGEGIQYYQTNYQIFDDLTSTQAAWTDFNNTLTEGVPGAIVGDGDTAFAFPGDAAVVVGPSWWTQLNPPDHPLICLSDGSFSVEAWVQVDAGLGAPQTIVSHDNGSADDIDFLLEIGPDDRFHFVTRATGGTYANDAGGVTAVTQDDIDADRWFHVVGVQDTMAGQVRLYVDGTLEAQVLLAGDPVSTRSTLQIGSRGDIQIDPGVQFTSTYADVTSFGQDLFTGAIDEVALYETPLSDETVRYHFYLGLGIDCVAPPQGDLHLDCMVDQADLTVLAAQWAQPCDSANLWCWGADLDHSGSVDLVDLATLASEWLARGI